MADVSEFLIQTPWWVYAIFIYILIRGLKARQTQTASLPKLMILPALFLALGIDSLIRTLAHIETGHGLLIIIWLMSFLLGGLVAFKIFRHDVLKVDTKQSRVTIQGSNKLLVMLLILFIVKYYFGYQMAINPEKAHIFSVLVWQEIILGILSGLLIGRFFLYLAHIYSAKKTLK